MSRNKLAQQFRGTRNDVQAAYSTIQTQFEQIRNGGKLSGGYNALHYEAGVLRQLCVALQDNYHKHADIYYDIAATMLPHVAPYENKPEFWETHLSSLRYIHNALCQEATLSIAQKFYALINAQPVHLQSKSDYRIYLNIHVKHLYVHYPQRNESELCQVLQSLGKLFQAMLHRGFIPNDLILEVNPFLGKRSGGFLKVLGGLPISYSRKLYEPLFQLLLNSGCMEEQQLIKLFPEYLSALLALIQVDGYGWQQSEASSAGQPFALQLLRVCRELYKTTTQHHVMQLLYYYLKLLLTRESTELKRPYIDLCQKLMQYMQHRHAQHGKSSWYIDFLMVMLRIQKQLHQLDSKLPCFELFWRGLAGEGAAAAYSAHFELLQCLMQKITVSGSSSTLATSCPSDAECPNLERHSAFSLGCCALIAYSEWTPEEQATLPKMAQKTLAGIIGFAMDAALKLSCFGSSSLEMQHFVWHLLNVASKVSSRVQFQLLHYLLRPLQQFHQLLSSQELRQLLSRLYKASFNYGENPELSAQLQSSYIAALPIPAWQYQQLCLFYRNSSSGSSKWTLTRCAYAMHAELSLIPTLTEQQLQRFFELDMLVVLANRKPPALLQCLIQKRRNDYQFVILARSIRTDPVQLREYERLHAELSQRGRQQLSREEQLVLGHASVTKLLVALETQKIKLPMKDLAERNLEKLMVQPKLLHLNIAGEMRLLMLANQAIEAFEGFFQRADAEPLVSGELLLDWESLLDDGIVAAMALSTMGYIPQADRAWLLLLRISRLLGERFTYLRAISHFFSRYTHHPLLDMEDELGYTQELLEELWPQLQQPHFFKRDHTTVMLCICQMALYYARIQCCSHAHLMLLHVDGLREECPERRGQSDIVLLTMQTVRFRICYQTQGSWRWERMPTALQQLDTLADSIKSFVSISSLDNGLLVLLLADFVRDSTECTANRLSERPNLSSSLLQILLQSGMVLGVVEVLISWLWTNLRMECLDKAQSKLRLIEHLLGLQPLTPSASPSLAKNQSSSLSYGRQMDEQSKHMCELVGKMLSLQLEQGVTGSVQPTRKQQQQQVSLTISGSSSDSSSSTTHTPRQALQSSSHLQLLRFLQVPSSLQALPQLECIYFTVGCLNARLHFLSGSRAQLDEFYNLANDWLQQDKQRIASLGHMLLVLHIHQINYLRAQKRSHLAIELTERALKLAETEQQLQQRVDVNYKYNLLLQLRTAQMELQQKPQQPRRALKFHASPPKTKQVLLKTKYLTAIESSSSSASKVKTPCLKVPAKFQIYTEEQQQLEDEEAALVKSTGSSSPEDGIDLNSCQVIDAIDLTDDVDPPKQSKPSRSTRVTRRKAALSTPEEMKSVATATPVTATKTRSRSRRQPIPAAGTATAAVEDAKPSSSSSRRLKRN